jgi:hypothetical protein
MKISCNGAFQQSDRSGGSGFIIHISNGEVISTGFGKADKVLEPIHTELIACLQALQRGVYIRLQRVILETNATMVVQVAFSSDIDRSLARGLVSELNDLLRCNFSSWSVVHNPRTCNLVVHGIMALGCKLSLGIVPVFDTIPICIHVLLANDLAPVIA